MKKLLVSLFILLLMVGCGNNKTLKCSSSRSGNNMRGSTNYDIEYQNKDVKFVTITYDYTQDGDVVNNTTTTDVTDSTGNTVTTSTTTNMDGVNADSDGLTHDNDTKNDNNTNSNEVVDGVTGDVIDGIVDGVTDTILDIAGIKSTYENQIGNYENIEGFSYKVDTDEDNEYKVIYKIDMDKISDSDLARFNLDRDLDTVRSNYEGLGYTCEEK